MDTNIKYLVDNNINIWNKDAYNYSNKEGYNRTLEDFLEQVKLGNFTGNLGRIYGAQWRNFRGLKGGGFGNWTGVDQISNLIKGLKENPMGTKHIVTAWNPAELDDMALPPCHWSFEILVEPIGINNRIKLSSKMAVLSENQLDSYGIPKYQFTLKWHQRSVDTFLGLPFNIASYGLLSQKLGLITNMKPKGIIGDLSNVHIYEPHLNAVKEQLSRDVNKYDKCELEMDNLTNSIFCKEFDNWGLGKMLENMKIEDFRLKGYTSHPPIKAEMLAYDK